MFMFFFWLWQQRAPTDESTGDCQHSQTTVVGKSSDRKAFNGVEQSFDVLSELEMRNELPVTRLSLIQHQQVACNHLWI